MAFWENKTKENLLALYFWLSKRKSPACSINLDTKKFIYLALKKEKPLCLAIKNKSLYLLSKLGYQKKNLYLFKALSLFGNQTIAYSNKNFILLLPHFGFLLFNLNKIYSLNALFLVSNNPRKQQLNIFFIYIIMKQFGDNNHYITSHW